MWCVLSEEEQRKCEAFAAATADDQEKTQEQAFGSYYRKVSCTFDKKCISFVSLTISCDLKIIIPKMRVIFPDYVQKIPNKS
jgi:hypothetical protein